MAALSLTLTGHNEFWLSVPPAYGQPTQMRVLLIVVVVAFAGVAGSWWLDRTLNDMAQADGYPSANITRSGDVLVMNGLIVNATLARVAQEMATAPVRRIRVWSGGGMGAASILLARRLNQAGVVMEVGPRSVCSSACVMLLAELRPELRAIDPGAWLRVHGSSDGPDDLRDAERPDQNMGPWVRKLSPAWFDYLAACTSKPLVRNAGLAMTWGEVRAVERGAGAACDRIAFRTKDWLFMSRPS